MPAVRFSRTHLGLHGPFLLMALFPRNVVDIISFPLAYTPNASLSSKEHNLKSRQFYNRNEVL